MGDTTTRTITRGFMNSGSLYEDTSWVHIPKDGLKQILNRTKTAINRAVHIQKTQAPEKKTWLSFLKNLFSSNAWRR